MNTKNVSRMTQIWLLATALSVGAAYANNITVTNVTWNAASPDTTSYVQFDLSWENSWRAAWTAAAENNVTDSPLGIENWDAAWVFVKYRLTPDGEWSHATLATNSTDHVMPDGATNAAGITAGRALGEGVGVFVYRNADGHGSNDFKNVKLRWLHNADIGGGDSCGD